MGASTERAKYEDKEFVQAIRKNGGCAKIDHVVDFVGCDRTTAWRRLESLSDDEDSPITRFVDSSAMKLYELEDAENGLRQLKRKGGI